MALPPGLRPWLPAQPWLLGHDVYTWFLMEGLDRGDRDLDGAVTLTEAHDYARERTYVYTEGRQRPSARAVLLGRDPIVLAGDAAGGRSPLLYSYDDNADGITVVLDGQTKGELPGGIPVEAGVHRVQLLAGEGQLIHSKRVRLEPGERISLTELVRDRQGWSFRVAGVAGAGDPSLRPAALGPGLAVEWRPAGSRWGIQAAGSSQRRETDDLGFRHTAADLSLTWDVVHRPVVRLGPVVGVSSGWTRWEQPFEFTSTALATTPGVGLRLALHPVGPLEVGAEGRFGAFLVPMSSDGVGVVPSLHAVLFAGFTN